MESSIGRWGWKSDYVVRHAFEPFYETARNLIDAVNKSVKPSPP